MNPIELAVEIEERYQRYLKTSFYFRDQTLRDSFEKALSSGHLSKGPYIGATPVFKQGQAPRSTRCGRLFSAARDWAASSGTPRAPSRSSIQGEEFPRNA